MELFLTIAFCALCALLLFLLRRLNRIFKVNDDTEVKDLLPEVRKLLNRITVTLGVLVLLGIVRVLIR